MLNTVDAMMAYHILWQNSAEISTTNDDDTNERNKVFFVLYNHNNQDLSGSSLISCWASGEHQIFRLVQ